MTLYLDELHFKHVILSLLSKSLYSMSNEGTLEISADEKIIDQKRFLELTIKDNGFGLEREDIDRIETNLGYYEFYLFQSKNLPFKIIEEIIKLHQGKIHCYAKWQEGSSITIVIPGNLEELLPAQVVDETDGMGNALNLGLPVLWST